MNAFPRHPYTYHTQDREMSDTGRNHAVEGHIQDNEAFQVQQWELDFVLQ